MDKKRKNQIVEDKIKSMVWVWHTMVILLFAGLATFFFWPFVQEKLSFIWDTREFGFINLNLVSKSLAEGVFPFWNQYLFSGHPFAGDIESSMFYPVQWIFTFIFGEVSFTELSFYFIFHFFLGAVFSYLLCFKLSKSVFASFAGAVVFAFSGYALGHISHLGQVTMYMWIPGVFLGFILAVEKKKLFYSLLAGFILAMAILVGHSNTTIYIGLGILILLVFEFIRNKDRWKVLFHFILAGIFALLLAAVMILPVIELTMQSNRLDLTYEKQSEGFSLNPLNLGGLVDPNYNGVLSGDPISTYTGSVDLTQGYFYIGLLSLIFIIVALFVRNRYKWFFVVFGFLSLMAAFGKYTYVNFILFNYFPGFDKVRMAVQIMCMCFFAASVLTAIGATKVFEMIRGFIDGVSRRSGIRRISMVFVSVFICFLVVGDIFYAGYDKRFYSESVGPGTVFERSNELRFVDSLDGIKDYRIADEVKFFDVPNKWEYYGVENIFGIGGIRIKKYDDLFVRNDRINWQVVSDDLLDFLNVKYVITKRDLSAEGYKKLDIVHANVYENPDALPRAYFVENYLLEKDFVKQLQKIKDGAVDFKNEVMLAEVPRYLGKTSILKGEAFQILERQSDYFSVKTSSKKEKILVFSEVDYPGWQLYVDGEKENYLIANYIFRAVPLKAGEHTVVFEYRPWSIYFGAILSVSALVLFLVVLIFKLFFKNRK